MYNLQRTLHCSFHFHEKVSYNELWYWNFFNTFELQQCIRLSIPHERNRRKFQTSSSVSPWDRRRDFILIIERTIRLWVSEFLRLRRGARSLHRDIENEIEDWRWFPLIYRFSIDSCTELRQTLTWKRCRWIAINSREQLPWNDTRKVELHYGSSNIKTSLDRLRPCNDSCIHQPRLCQLISQIHQTVLRWMDYHVSQSKSFPLRGYRIFKSSMIGSKNICKLEISRKFCFDDYGSCKSQVPDSKRYCKNIINQN